MFETNRHIVLVIIGFALMFPSCSGYEKLLKSNDYQLKYTKAIEYYNEGEYVRASRLLDQIASIYRGTTKADTVSYYQAYSYYHQNDYILAGHHFKNLALNYPGSVYAEESDFLAAYCYYKQSPRPALDQDNTMKAIIAFQMFMINYPGSDRLDEARDYITELQDKLVEKSYMSAKLYYDLGEYKSSIIALQNSLNDYPETNHREELMFLILKSNYLLADNSIISKQKERFQNTVDEYYSFISEFPESHYRREADHIYEESLSYLDQ
jgi:outer membrane protein assembly factor BamD